MIYKTVIIEANFEAGVTIGGVRSILAGNGAGELTIKKISDGYAEVEVAAHNPLVMSYVEEQLAAYV